MFVFSNPSFIRDFDFGRLQERKKELVDIQGQLEARRAAFVESEKQSRRRETELTGQLAVTQAQLCEVRAAGARSKEEQLEAVLAGSQAVSGSARVGMKGRFRFEDPFVTPPEAWSDPRAL